MVEICYNRIGMLYYHAPRLEGLPLAELIEINTYPVINVLSKLLQDKTTGKNIIYGTDYYLSYGCSEKAEMTQEAVRSFGAIDIQPRVKKAQADQSERTRSKAEVFTPTWIVKKMNDHCDSVWQESKYADDWQKYVQLRVLEITCGEAPFLVTRYDTTTGEPLAIKERTGILDRKLRAIQADSEELWLKWAYIAFESTYGYEFQGDNLFIARINLLVTFCDYLEERWHRKATDSELKHITNIIVWNIWQMDGLNDTVPLGEPGEEFHQFSLFGDEEPVDLEADSCKIYNHRSSNPMLFADIKEGKSNMRFDFVIGNPPYQDESIGDNESTTPLYHYFYEASFSISDRVELITPARFLFDAGYTPKEWNQKMLNDPHLKVLMYQQKSSEIFANTSISGGVAIIYRDSSKNYGSIGIFTPFQSLNTIIHKVWSIATNSLSEIVSNRGMYRYSDLAYEEFADLVNQTADRRIAPSCFERMPSLFTEMKPNYGKKYIRIYGSVKTERIYRWFRRDYLSPVENLDKYKVFISKADGAAGQIGAPVPARICGRPVVIEPGVASTETFIAIGSTDLEAEASAIAKYIKTRFARTMLGVLKVTQNNAKPTWEKVPLQDFTSNSDIDWTQSISEIDRQLYAKYGLTQEEMPPNLCKAAMQ